MAHGDFRVLLDEAPTRVDIQALERAINAYGEVIDRAKQRVHSLKDRLEQAQRDVEQAMQAQLDLASYRDFVMRLRGMPQDWDGDSSSSSSTRIAAAKPSDASSASPPGEKRSAILTVLADGRERALREIHEVLVGRGVLDDGPSDKHLLQVTLSRMYHAGEVDRSSKGVYRAVHPERANKLAAARHSTQGGGMAK